MKNITPDRLREKLHYNEETGIFTWLATNFVGRVAGSPDKDGYIRIRVDYHRFLAHRLAFRYMTGEWPVQQVDHINLDKADNRWANLREATAQQNSANRAVRSTKKEMKGVHRDGRQWKALIGINGKTNYLGLFKTQEEANAAYLAAAVAAHGEFARS